MGSGSRISAPSGGSYFWGNDKGKAIDLWLMGGGRKIANPSGPGNPIHCSKLLMYGLLQGFGRRSFCSRLTTSGSKNPWFNKSNTADKPSSCPKHMLISINCPSFHLHCPDWAKAARRVLRDSSSSFNLRFSKTVLSNASTQRSISSSTGH